jgi:TonB-dependent starch-binding outer membrane protein SusC
MEKIINDFWLLRTNTSFTKFILIMKISFLLFIFGMLDVIANPTYSQSTKVTLNMKDVTIESVLNEIEKNSEFYFFFNQKLIDVSRKVDVEVTNKPIKDILAGIFKDANVDYVVMDRQVILSPKEMSKSLVELQQQQAIKVTGTITDLSTGEPIPGVNIQVEGSTAGAITDIDGKYSLSLDKNDATLIISYIGYLTENIAVNGRTIIDMSLSPDIKALEEVVVVGYGTTRKIDLTGSVSTVKTKDLTKSASTSIDQMLQGKAAGLTLTSVSAQPGGRLNINIRGGTNPLYVIDGVPIMVSTNPNNANSNIRTADPSIMTDNLGFSGGVDRDPLNSINPSDIESIDILKDASAAAIYGSAAADGVILITTKKGKAGKAKVEYNGSYTIQTPKKYFDLMSSEEFMTQHNRFQKDQKLLNDKSGIYGPNPEQTFTPLFSDSVIAANNINTDWLGILMRNGNINDQNLSLSGGTENTTVFASFNYYGNDAILENSDFKRYSGRINFAQQIGKRVKANANVTFSQINANNASTGANQGGPEKYNMLQAAYVYSPTVPVYDSLGQYSKTFDPKITNPAAFLIINDIIRTNRFLASPNIEVGILKDLKMNLVAGIDRVTNNRNFYLPREARNVQLPNGMAQILTNRIDNYSGEAYLTFNHQYKNSILTVVGGAGYYKSIYDGFGLQAVDFFTDAYTYNKVQAATDKTQGLMNSYKEERTKISQFIRINYSLLDKYLVSFVGRRDGSSIFAPNKKYGFFPGFSAAWRISQESFLKDVNSISELKLRAGYGTAGNESFIGNNSMKLYKDPYHFLIGPTNYTGVALSQIDNPDLTWETDATAGVGLDLGLFANRITATIDYFNKTKKDLLDYIQLPSDAAVGRVAAAVGSQKTQGWEFTITSNNLVKEFIWSTNITLTTYTLKWSERNPQVTMDPWVKEKDPVYAIYGWETDGLLTNSSDTTGYMSNMTNRPSFGNIKYVDQNKDGKLDAKDVVLLADGTPKWSFGFDNKFKYKGFDLDIYIYGLLGRTISNGYRNFLSPVGLADNIYPSNTITEVKDVWSSDNPEGIYPGLSNSSNPYDGSNPTHNTAPNNTIYNDFWLVNGSFARIKNITLGYTIPERLTNKLTIKSVRFFIDVQNLYVFTKYKGIDPEVSDINPYPQALSTSFGLNVTF